jgi:pimeloyl-ACP methyl ester carboxylesterase
MKLLFIVLIICPMILHAQVPAANRADIHPLFLKAQTRFSAFEKEHGHFIDTPNARIHYLTWGSSLSRPFIWLHGSLSTAYELSPFAADLVKAGYYVIAVDYYGHGQTSMPGHEVSLYHLADDVRYLMDHLHLEKTVLGGWSRGGFASAAFYDAYPEKVLGLVLEDGGSVAVNTNYHNMDSTRLVTRLKEAAGQVIPDTSYATEFDAYRAFYDYAEGGDQFELLTWIRQDRQGKWVVGPGLWKLFHMSDYTQSLDNIFRPTCVPLFAESMSVLEPKILFRNLHVPMLILDPVSGDDLFPFEKENEALRKQHPDLIRHEIFAGTGHNIHYQRPALFIEKVLDFLRTIKPAGR